MKDVRTTARTSFFLFNYGPFCFLSSTNSTAIANCLSGVRIYGASLGLHHSKIFLELIIIQAGDRDCYFIFLGADKITTNGDRGGVCFCGNLGMSYVK